MWRASLAGTPRSAASRGGSAKASIFDSAFPADRVFTPKVSGGSACFVLTPRTDRSTDFVMEERFSALILPLVKGSMPSFGPVFERYANDLKREAEQTAH